LRDILPAATHFRCRTPAAAKLPAISGTPRAMLPSHRRTGGDI